MTITSEPTAVISTDGTRIAVYREGTGPTMILIDPALSTHQDSTKLARALADRFDVIRYDRRGRGASDDAGAGTTDTDREIEDIAALIELAGGSALLFGQSSGAALALAAASRLGGAVDGVVAYEPPYICDDSRPPVAADLPARIAAAVERGDRSAAAGAFFVEAVGVPRWMLLVMRALPMWRHAKAITPTLRYDFAVLEGTQQGHPLPLDRWAGLTAPTVVMVGGKSETFFHVSARTLADALPTVEYTTLEGAHHGTPTMSPGILAEWMIQRFVAS